MSITIQNKQVEVVDTETNTALSSGTTLLSPDSVKPADAPADGDPGHRTHRQVHAFPCHPAQNKAIDEGVYRARIRKACIEQYRGGEYLRLELVLDDGTPMVTSCYFREGSRDQRFGVLCHSCRCDPTAVLMDPSILGNKELGVAIYQTRGRGGQRYSDVDCFMPAAEVDIY